MEYLLLFLSILIFTIQTVSFKEFNRSFMKNLSSYFMFNFLYFGMVVVINLIPNPVLGEIHAATAILAVSFGVIFVLGILCYMKAMENGPLSLSSLIYSFGIIVPIAFGFFLWDENISIMQAAGLVLLFATFYLGSKSGSDPVQSGTSHGVNFKWILFSFLAFLANGGLMTTSKAQQMIMPGKEIKEFLVLSFGTGAILSLAIFVFVKLKTHDSISHLKSTRFLLVVLAAGLTTAYGNQISVFLSGRIPAVIQFPTVNGGIVLASSLLSVVLFKEKLTRQGIAGLVLGLAALVLLSLK